MSPILGAAIHFIRNCLGRHYQRTKPDLGNIWQLRWIGKFVCSIMFVFLRRMVILTMLLTTTLTPTSGETSTAASATALIPANASDSEDLMNALETTAVVEKTPTTPGKPQPPVVRYQQIGNCVFTPAVLADQQPVKEFRNNRFYIEIPLTTVGAIMIFLVNGRRMFKGSAYFYMCVLALADFSFVISNAVGVGITLIAKNKLYLNNHICSLMVYYLPFAFQGFAVSALMAMTIERTLVVMFPFKFQNFFTVKKAVVLLSVMFVCSFAAFCPFIWAVGSGVRPTQSGPLYFCGFYLRRVNGKIVRVYGYGIDISDSIKTYVYLVLPMIVLLGCNIAIVVAMTKAFKAKVKLTGEEKGGHDDGQLRHITIQVLSVSIFFVLLALPYACIFNPLSPGLFKWLYESCTKFYISFWLKEIAKFLYEMTHCLNAYMYAVSSKKFRTELIDALHIRSRKKDPLASGSGTRQTALSSASAGTITQS
ncbi:uncharacterized protein LOC135482821 [Lineus longissimus]|uniref:uncharacterized protein LOC135482821 n=1 Tax=Lineus longissimus TaxID=88925 RepID=UPI002B4F03AF